MNVYLGTQGWSYKDWVGSFYPPGTKAADYLPYYAQVFDAVELDTTFYGIPTPERVAGWSRATPGGFQFTAKTPRSITHDRRLVDAGGEFEEFVGAVERLGEKLGAILIQLPPDFTVAERPALEAFLERLPAGFRFAAEFRHRSWLTEETYDLLRAHGVAWTMIDLRYMPITIQTTADFAYVRWLGDHRAVIRVHETIRDRSAELTTWAIELEGVARRVERVYGFVNNHYSGHSPADVRRLRRALGLPEERATSDRRQQGTLL
jgi:uncharacterized protein YecE (DUF72 family)